MANTIRIKRRAAGGSAGAPASLANAELAYNEVDDVLYYGKGTGGAGGAATTVEAIGGAGAYVGLSGTQTITGNKTFSGTIALGTPTSGNLVNCTFPTLNQNTTGTAATVTANAQPNITSVGTLTALSVTGTVTAGTFSGSGASLTLIPNSATTATNVNTASTIVARDASGNFLAGTINKVTLTAPATGSTLTIADGKTLTASNTLTLAGTDSTTMTFPATSSTVMTTATPGTLTGSMTLRAGTASAGTAPLYLTSGTNLTTAAAGAMEFDGTNLYFSPSTTRKTIAFTDSTITSSTFIGTTSVALNRTSGALTLAGITLTTPVLGVATATTINKVTLTAPATGSTLTIADGKTLTASNTLTLTGTDSSSVAFGTGGTVVYTSVTSLSSLSTVGTIGTGVWQGTAIAGQYGGTGVANTGKTITLGGNLTTSGAFATTLTATGTTSITLPTSGTLATTDATSLTSGTLDNARLPAAATNITSVGTLTSLTVSGTTTVATPVNPTDAANKAYVDAVRQGLDVKESVRAATTAAINLSTGLVNTTVIDGVTLATGDRVLVKDQVTGSENGIYVVAASGAASRSTDANTSSKVTAGMFAFVSEGTINADAGWVLATNDTIVLDTTALSFVQFSGAGQITAGDGLTKSGNTLNVVGTSARITANADSIDIASTYVGQASITTLGVIATGTWNGTAIGLAYGGTGATDAAGARSALGLVIGTNVQAYDAELTALAGLTSTADALPYFTGSGTAAVTTLSSFMRTLLDDADASTARTTLGLGSIATQASNNVSITGGSIDGITFDCGTF